MIFPFLCLTAAELLKACFPQVSLSFSPSVHVSPHLSLSVLACVAVGCQSPSSLPPNLSAFHGIPAGDRAVPLLTPEAQEGYGLSQLSLAAEGADNCERPSLLPCADFSQGTATWFSQLSFDSSLSSFPTSSPSLFCSPNTRGISPLLSTALLFPRFRPLASPLDHCLTLGVLPPQPICVSPFWLLPQMPEAECFVNNRNSLLTAWEVGKSKIKELADSVPDEGLLPGSWKTIFCVLKWY